MDSGDPGVAQEPGRSTPAALATAGVDAGDSHSHGAGSAGVSGGGASAATAAGDRCRIEACAGPGGSLGDGESVAGVAERGSGNAEMRGGAEADAAGVGAVDEGRVAGVVVPLGVTAGCSMDCSSRPLVGGALTTSDNSVSTTSGRTVTLVSTTGLFGSGVGSAWAASATRDAPAAAAPSTIARSQSLT
ncbi:hypothetical protein [Micromonospora sp. NPDC007230]|uniref:hypothetical protein n=1 Tax=Micromonospora sp. NPDC007230 TaxID=3364237 RepID=UPI00367386FA